jgi:hypothetical protein
MAGSSQLGSPWGGCYHLVPGFQVSKSTSFVNTRPSIYILLSIAPGYRIGVSVYIEHQSVCPFVGIGSPHPLSRKRECLPPWTDWEWGEQHSLAVEGMGRPNTDVVAGQRVDRVLGLFSSHPNWDLLTRMLVCPPPTLVPGGDTHSLSGEGVGGPNSDEGTDTVVL